MEARVWHMADWSDIDGTITLTINFNDTVDEIETDDASVQTVLVRSDCYTDIRKYSK